MEILLLEDDYIYATSICEYLQDLGFSVDVFSDGDLACKTIANKFYHLYILDVKVINTSGFEVLAYIKSLNIASPVMMMTSRTDIASIKKGYELGCNEYLKKPFELDELKYRVKELLKQFFHTNNQIIKIANDFTYDYLNKTLSKNNKIVELTNKEINLVEYLLGNKSSFVSVNNIYEYVWNNEVLEQSDVSDVRVYVKRIRAKTSDDFIISQRGLGYKINV
ncbi:response regulator transcription factor [Campylobacter sp. Cr9]|uniref:response regulator transcription factor n=1 Tax=unclassified Campylobacter TaxID=2593542 RepID=UPI001EFC1988|nr:response regulator transcription factor [Campylobacter sp. RM5004]MBZ7984782.1 response regulator transcription factor [Campylobacter sp. Cr9]ULO02062.1 two-component system response regulator [Campylobacter sp. RM5004]